MDDDDELWARAALASAIACCSLQIAASRSFAAVIRSYMGSCGAQEEREDVELLMGIVADCAEDEDPLETAEEA